MLKLSVAFTDFAREVEQKFILLEKGLFRTGLRLCSRCKEWKALISIGKDGACEECLKRAVEKKLPTVDLFEDNDDRP